MLGMGLRTTLEGVDHTILDGLFQRNLIQHREFGLFFREATEGESYMVIGKIARKYMPQEAYPVGALNEPGWTIQVDWMFLGGVPFNLYGYKAIVDTGATATYVPPDILETINAILEVTENVGGFNTIDCNKVEQLPALEFQGVNVKLGVYSSQYILQGKVSDDRRCYSPFL
ncbi:pepsin A, partial [Clonorchis sinensis]